jgi:hypothetical protein
MALRSRTLSVIATALGLTLLAACTSGSSSAGGTTAGSSATSAGTPADPSGSAGASPANGGSTDGSAVNSPSTAISADRLQAGLDRVDGFVQDEMTARTTSTAPTR